MDKYRVRYRILAATSVKDETDIVRFKTIISNVSYPSLSLIRWLEKLERILKEPDNPFESLNSLFSNPEYGVKPNRVSDNKTFTMYSQELIDILKTSKFFAGFDDSEVVDLTSNVNNCLNLVLLSYYFLIGDVNKARGIYYGKFIGRSGIDYTIPNGLKWIFMD